MISRYPANTGRFSVYLRNKENQLGVNIGMFNCPGWSQSGGPWVTAEQTMLYVISSDTRVIGPRKFSQKLATPIGQFQDIVVLAFPAPENDAQSFSALKPRITFTPAAENGEKIADGDLNTHVLFPVKPGPAKNPAVTLDIQLDAPLTARHLLPEWSEQSDQTIVPLVFAPPSYGSSSSVNPENPRLTEKTSPKPRHS